MTEEERIEWEADKYKYFGPDPNPVIEAALMKHHLAYREYAKRPTPENSEAFMRTSQELQDIVQLSQWQPPSEKQ
jgi:hypothetical protein